MHVLLLSLYPSETSQAEQEFMGEEDVQDVQATLQSRRVTMNSFATHRALALGLLVVKLNAISDLIVLCVKLSWT